MWNPATLLHQAFYYIDALGSIVGGKDRLLPQAANFEKLTLPKVEDYNDIQNLFYSVLTSNYIVVTLS